MTIRAAAVITALLVSSPAFALDGRLVGAWAQTQSDCARLFQKTHGFWRFRPGVLAFEQAYLISSGFIYSPMAECRVLRARQVKNSWNVQLDCEDSVSFDSMSVSITLSGAAELSYGYPDDPLLNQVFVRCP